MATAKVQPPPPKETTYDYGPEYAQRDQPDISGGTALAVLNASEIDRQMAFAQINPRVLSQFRTDAAELITQDEDSATMCIYSLPRRERNQETGEWEKKIIKGPSARFAEIIGYAWRNCKFGARTIGEDEEFVTSQGVFFDLQQNTSISYEVKRRITNRKGERYSTDMIGTTANAACSIALRNAVLKGVPKPAWKGLYALAEKTIMGDVKTLVDRRQSLIDKFKPFGLLANDLCKLCEVSGVSDIKEDALVTLTGIFNALHDGETTVEQLRDTISSHDESTAKKSNGTLEGIKAKYRQPQQADAPQNPTAPPTQENLDAEPPPETQSVAQQAAQAQQKLKQRQKTATSQATTMRGKHPFEPDTESGNASDDEPF